MVAMQVWCAGLILLAMVGLALGQQTPASLVLTMLCRDEDVNLKANLPSWIRFVDYFVFVLDNRTTDGSASTIQTILSKAGKRFKIVMNDFTGFGAARTLGLNAAWESFPQATHVMISDPDWSPNLPTINLRELDLSADVFRFTSIDAPRDGHVSKRKMDWLLRHCQGLSMKYHLHEVLDIGAYTVKSINWEVREVEKKGTWHTTAGHATSTSADRYKFDLSLLDKDLAMYPHDPHVHYYLGVTHENLATKSMATLGLLHPDVQSSIENAIKYLTIRATSAYTDELLEQRWGALIELGNIYMSLKRDDVQAIRWLSTCRAYNPDQVDCVMLLCQLYVTLGQLKPALQALDEMLTTERKVDRFHMFTGLWECDVPAVTLDLLSKKAQTQGVEAGEAMYFFVLHEMTKDPRCSHHKLIFNRAVRGVFNAALRAQGVDQFEMSNNFCAHPVLHQYLTAHRYEVHPCAAYREARALQEKCDIFQSTSPPAYEELQCGSFNRQFLGTAILPDITHHVFAGNGSAFLTKGRTLRFLFAEHFNAEMLYNLLGQLQRQPVADFEIVALSPESSKLEEIKSRLATCRAQVKVHQAARVKFVGKSLLQYAADRAAGQFDFIEYNAGMSKAADPYAELRALSALLQDGGAMGVTYFSRNHHADAMHALVDARNTTHMVPFSMEAARLVKNYLDQHKLGILKADNELVTHLGGEPVHSPVALYLPAHLQQRVRWRSYLQSEAEALVTQAGLKIASWVPTAYARPFEEMQHYDVLKYRSLGMSQERFVQELMTSFRYSMYVVKPAASSPGTQTAEAGRFQLTSRVFEGNRSSPSLASRLLIVDRMGYLAGTFQNMEQLAKIRQSTTIEFAHYALPGDVRFSFILSPVIAPCLASLSARPSLQSLHDMNVNFAATEGYALVETEAQNLLISLISFLEKLNIVTFEFTDKPPVSGPSAGRTFKIETISDRREKAQAGAGGAGAGDGSRTSKVGGLNVRSVPKSSTSDNRQDEKEPADNVRSEHGAGRTAASAPAKPAGVNAGKSATAPAASSSEEGGPGLSTDEQVARMRMLGYSDEMIEQLLGVAVEAQSAPAKAVDVQGKVEEKKYSFGDGLPTTEPVDPAAKLESATKAKGVIDLLTRFTQHRAKDAKTGMPAEAATPGEAARVINTNLPFTRSDDDKTPPVTFSMNRKGDAKSDMVTGGGLKMPPQSKEPTPPGSAFQQSSGSFAQRNSAAGSAAGDRGGKQGTAQKQTLKASQIKMPAVQTEAALLQSFRSLKCANSAEQTKRSAQCQEPKTLKRKTAHPAATSSEKVTFDLAQLRHIQSQKQLQLSAQAKTALSAVSQSYGEVAKFLTEFNLANPYKVVRLSANSAVHGKGEYINRAVHIERDPGLSADQLVHQGAMQYLHSIRREVDQHDFLVVDVILQDAAMQKISQMLLSSTVWFDATNGAAFAAHHDDGLVFKSIHTLVQQIALALSENNKPLTVHGFYTLAMGMHTEAHSPVFMANKDDFNVVLWLSPQETTTDVAAAERDGLRIYNEASAGKLFSQGVSVYPSAHSDFLSRSSSLAIDLHARCNGTNSEFVPRSPNRLVLVRAKKLCTLLTPGTAQARSFEKDTMIALVMVLSPPL